MLPTFDLLNLQDQELGPDGHDAGDDAAAATSLQVGDVRRFRLDVTAALATPFKFLYGGSGIAACAEAAERATGRPLQWITTQFIGSPAPGDVVDIDVTVAAHGRATTQSQVTARVDGREVFTSLCAHSNRATGDQRGFVTMPDVPGPDDCPEMSEPFTQGVAGSFFDHLDRRVGAGVFALDAVDNPQSGLLALWCKMPGREIGSAATQAFVADILPLAVCASLGVPPGGTSLDNTMRVVDPEPTDWVLLEIIAEGYHRSIGHGTVRLWSVDGRLLGVAQQTCIVRTSHHSA